MLYVNNINSDKQYKFIIVVLTKYSYPRFFRLCCIQRSRIVPLTHTQLVQPMYNLV